MKIGICDDDSLFLELMTKYVKQYEKDNCKELLLFTVGLMDRQIKRSCNTAFNVLMCF